MLDIVKEKYVNKWGEPVKKTKFISHKMIGGTNLDNTYKEKYLFYKKKYLMLKNK